MEEEFVAAGAQIIWVLLQDRNVQQGTAMSCREFLNSSPRNSDGGWCVGDGQTMNQPMPSDTTWSDSPIAIGRGYDLIVSRRDMVVRDAPTHGTPGGNENLTGSELLERVQAVLEAL